MPWLIPTAFYAFKNWNSLLSDRIELDGLSICVKGNLARYRIIADCKDVYLIRPDGVEIPLCISDVALFSFMKRNALQSWTFIKNLIDITEMFSGVLTILWHNWTFSYPASFAGLFGKEWTRLYEKILEYCNKKNAWLTSCEKISEFFSLNY